MTLQEITAHAREAQAEAERDAALKRMDIAERERDTAVARLHAAEDLVVKNAIERDALAADLAAARKELGALGPVEYIRETNEHPRIRTYIQCIKDDIDALAIRVVKEAQ